MQLQQGDVNIVSTTTRPEKLRPILDSGLVRQGTATGHSHRLIGLAFKLFDVVGMSGVIFAEVRSRDCKMVHEEHAEIELPVGDYVFSPTVEFDHFTGRTRNVWD